MALAVADRVKETSTTAGTGTLTLLGAVSGYQSFSVIGSGNTTYYCIVDDNTGEWEVGVGTYTSPNQLSRDTVLSSSSGGSAITFLGNIKQVFVTYPAERSVYENAAGSLVLSKVEATTGIITNLTSTSAVLTNVSATSATVTNLTLTSLTISSLSITNLSAASATITTGNLTFSSTAQRITGDFSNATFANRLMFQTSTTNANTAVESIPSGTGTATRWTAYNNSDPTNASFLQFGITGTTAAVINSGIRGTGTYVPITFETSGSEKMRLDTSGNLGIGTASPGTKLQVAGGVSAEQVQGRYFGFGTAGFSLDGTTVNDYGITYTTISSTFNTVLAGYSNIKFATNQTEQMRIDSSGNVGIGGTADATTKLQVTGTLPTSGTVSRSILMNGTIPSGSTFAGMGIQSILNTQAASFTAANLWHFNAAQGTIGAGSSVTNQMGFYAESSLTGATNNYGFYSDIASGSNRWNFYAAGTAQNYFAGNVGIGTASPGFLFDTFNSSTATDYIAGRFYSNAAAAGESRTWLKLEKGTNYGGAVGGYLSQGVGSGLIFGTQNNASTPTERMRIDNNGNVGIGTTSAGGFNGTVNLGGSGNPASGYLEGWGNAQSIPSSVTTRFDGFFSVATTAAAAFTLPELRHFTAQGNTKGAGSTVTSQFGFYADSGLTTATNNYGFYSNIASGSNRWNFYAAGTADNYFAGNVGIGTASPGTYGKFTVDDSGIKSVYVRSSSTNFAGVYLENTNSATKWQIGVEGGAFNAAGTLNIGIDGTGSAVLLGTDRSVKMIEVYSDTVGATNRDLYIDDTGLLGYVSSIRASKTNIQNLADVSWLKSLTPVSYQYRKKDEDGNYTSEADGNIDYGLIAEDVEAVAPELCFYDIVDGNSELRGVTYSKLITPMLKYIQQLESRIAALEAK